MSQVYRLAGVRQNIPLYPKHHIPLARVNLVRDTVLKPSLDVGSNCIKRRRSNNKIDGNPQKNSNKKKDSNHKLQHQVISKVPSAILSQSTRDDSRSKMELSFCGDVENDVFEPSVNAVREVICILK